MKRKAVDLLNILLAIILFVPFKIYMWFVWRQMMKELMIGVTVGLLNDITKEGFKSQALSGKEQK